MGGDGSRFQSTLWETVHQASRGEPAAIERMISDYWKPIYFFIRRRGHPVEDAKDLTQGFLGRLVEKEFLKDVSPERGRFRSFVMASVENYLSTERRKAGALKRGGAFNYVQAENDLSSAEPSPEDAFFRGWALTVLERAMDRLAAEVTPQDLELLGGAVPAGMSASERKNRRYRLRLRLREYLRESLRPSVDRDGDVESEIRQILTILS
jgi:RNA polymerase sigma-70 factor (ECF subfamily)